MRFLLAVFDHEGNLGTDDEMAAIDVFNDGLVENGHWITACGIAGPSTATVVDNRANLGHIADGPVNKTREYMSGFWLIEAADLETAQRLATQGSRACNRKVELRKLHGD